MPMLNPAHPGSVLKELFESLRVLTVDLNNDGVPEVIVQPSEPGSWCGATGNCTFWIFLRWSIQANSGRSSVAVETFNILPDKTFGYSDLVLGTHDSASEKSAVKQIKGKSSHPEFEQVKVYLRKQTHKSAKRRWAGYSWG